MDDILGLLAEPLMSTDAPRPSMELPDSTKMTNWAVRAAVDRWLEENPLRTPEGWLGCK